MAKTAKPELFLSGPTDGAPTFEHLMLLFERVTGKQASDDPADYEQARAIYEAEAARRQKDRRK